MVSVVSSAALGTTAGACPIVTERAAQASISRSLTPSPAATVRPVGMPRWVRTMSSAAVLFTPVAVMSSQSAPLQGCCDPGGGEGVGVSAELRGGELDAGHGLCHQIGQQSSLLLPG